MHHRGFIPRVRPPWIVVLDAAASGLFVAVTLSLLNPLWAKVESWRQEGPSAFAKCHRESVVVSDTGRVRLGHALEPVGTLNAGRVWDLARTRDGVLLAATGDSGQVFRREPKPDALWTVFYDSTDSQVLSLVGMPGRLPVRRARVPTASSSIYAIRSTRHLAPTRRSSTSGTWPPVPRATSMPPRAPTASCGSGRERAAGPCSMTASPRICSAWRLGPDGSVYAGSDGEGLIYRVGPDGKTTILFDAPQAEVRTLLVAADGTIYAGTAAEAGRAERCSRLAVLDTRRLVQPARRAGGRPGRRYPRCRRLGRQSA